MMKLILRAVIASAIVWAGFADVPVIHAEDGSFQSEPLFPREKKHNHASCIVECADGSLLVAWYRGTGERTADDVQIMGARMEKGAKAWSEWFVMADTPGYPDMNPALFAAPDKSLWMIWPTVLDHRWESALLKYARADSDAGPKSPNWTKEGVMHITPGPDFAKQLMRGVEAIRGENVKINETEVKAIEARAKDLLYQRLGWMPRVHATVLPSGRWLWPLYCDTYSISIVAISDDQGKTWRASGPIIGFGNIQPSIVRKNDGTLVALMRDNGPHHKIRLSYSKDNGETWSDAVDSSLPNPGAGIEATRLANGHWALIYNDLSRGRHSLAVSISTDEGATWSATRHVEKHEQGQGSYHYPSIIQARDGRIHISYTSGGVPAGSTIMHASFDEAWVLKGD